MTNQKPSERIAELLNEMIDVFRRVDTAPHSPIDGFVPSKTRRNMRRHAERLRRGEAQVRFKNLYTAEQLAGILENTARRDEIRQHVEAEFFRIGREIGRLMKEDPEGTRQSWERVFTETYRQAREQGPGSDISGEQRESVLRPCTRRRHHSRKRSRSKDDIHLVAARGGVALAKGGASQR